MAPAAMDLLQTRRFLSKRKRKTQKARSTFHQKQLNAAQSAAESRLYLTAKIFRSNDRTFLGWDSTEVQEDLVKMALTADDQWASSFAAKCGRRTRCLLSVSSITTSQRGVFSWNCSSGDVLFVQSLKDGSGREPDVNALTSNPARNSYRPLPLGFSD